MGKDYQTIVEKLDLIKLNIPELGEEYINVLEEAADIISDYEAAVEQTAELQQKYEVPTPAIYTGEDARCFRHYQCPECSGQVRERRNHCSWCGKALDWRKK